MSKYFTNFPESYQPDKIEQEIIRFWQKNNLLEKSIRQRDSNRPFTFYDGPITANNLPHYGHALTMLLKDIMPRYWTMKGYRVDRSLGWDCQGIPVEYEVEKRLKFSKKEDIEKFGVKKFNNLCRESVATYQKDIRWLTNRMGRWINDKEEYETMNAPYIESVWWSLQELYKKDLLYEGYKVVPYSTRAGTTLSNSEVSLGGYKNIIDPAVTVKFKIKDQDFSLLAWTTTPWTLVGNLLLAVKSDITYSLVEYKKEKFVVATDLLKKVFSSEVIHEITELRKMTGADLIGLEYEPLFNYFTNKKKEGCFVVVEADFVTVEEGTGLVHLAPYGEDDSLLLMKKKIPLFDYLDDTGHFTDKIPLVARMFYKKANKVIIDDLQKRQFIFAQNDYEHRMPMCWRTDTPLIYKPIHSWYVKVTALRDKLIAENNQINWTPHHMQQGRFGKWLENTRDWALSRNRYWGTPLPIWKCDKTGQTEVIGSFAELETKSGQKITDPHKPYVDEITWINSQTGGTMRRIADVLDVWYDSGAMPFARLHYPFENKDLFLKKFPAEYIAEGVDQTRGWFYSLHVLGIALFGQKAFKNIIVNGTILAKDGSKMSKSKKNYPPPQEILKTFGADILRYYMLNSPLVEGADVMFNEPQLRQIKGTIVLPIFNMVKYFLIYAKQYQFINRSVDPSTHLLDRWLVIRCQKLINHTNKELSKYHIKPAVKELQPFIDDLSSWFIKRSRERFVAGDQFALQTLFDVLLNLATTLAPLMPFLSEFVYQQLRPFLQEKDRLESIHLRDYPVSRSLHEEEEQLLVKMTDLRQISRLGQSLRIENALPLKQPLSTMQIKENKSKLMKLLANNKDWQNLLLADLNLIDLVVVKNLSSEKPTVWQSKKDDNISVSLNIHLSTELKNAGNLRTLLRTVQQLRHQAKLAINKKVALQIITSSKGQAFVEQHLVELKKKTFISKIEFSEKLESKILLEKYKQLKLNDDLSLLLRLTNVS